MTKIIVYREATQVYNSWCLMGLCPIFLLWALWAHLFPYKRRNGIPYPKYHAHMVMVFGEQTLVINPFGLGPHLALQMIL